MVEWFAHTLKRSLKRTVADAAAAIAVACVAFVVISLAIFDPYMDMRAALSNLLFLATLAVLLPLFWSEVIASRSCKTLVFLMAMVYGCVLAVSASALRGALGFSGDTDLRLYAVSSLVIFAALDMATLPLGWLLMRRVVTPWLEAGLDDLRWRRLCLFPAAVLIVVVGLYWMPRQIVSPPAEAALFASVLVVGIVVAVGYKLSRGVRPQACDPPVRWAYRAAQLQPVASARAASPGSLFAMPSLVSGQQAGGSVAAPLRDHA